MKAGLVGGVLIMGGIVGAVVVPALLVLPAVCSSRDETTVVVCAFVLVVPETLHRLRSGSPQSMPIESDC